MADNSDQIAEWNGVLGQRWAQEQAQTERIVAPFGDAALAAAGAAAGERVIDVGCGCGETSIELARRVGPEGRVLGVDISVPMLDVARRKAQAAGLGNLEFAEADASSAALPGGFDLLYSRFGVMFFSEPVAAFAHMRGALRPDGRMSFACWRAPRENPWAMAPLAAARQALGVEPAPMDPLAPGPFAFADPDRLRGILEAAGFASIEISGFNAAVSLGADAREAAEGAARIGPASRYIRTYGEGREDMILAAVETSLAAAQGPGGVMLEGAVWIVTARAS